MFSLRLLRRQLSGHLRLQNIAREKHLNKDYFIKQYPLISIVSPSQTHDLVSNEKRFFHKSTHTNGILKGAAEVAKFVFDKIDEIQKLNERCFNTLIKAGISPEEDELKKLYQEASGIYYGRHFGDPRIRISADNTYGAIFILIQNGIKYPLMSKELKEKMIVKEKKIDLQNKVR